MTTLPAGPRACPCGMPSCFGRCCGIAGPRGEAALRTVGMKNGMCTRSDARDHMQQPHQESELPASVAGTPQASRARVVGILPRATSKKGPQKNPVSAAGSCFGERGGSSWLSRAKRSLWAQDPSPFGICAEICANAQVVRPWPGLKQSRSGRRRRVISCPGLMRFCSGWLGPIN